MSFAFAAIGSKNQVVSQLRHVDVSSEVDDFNKAGREIALLIARHLEESQPSEHDGYAYSYIVKANGHSSKTGSPLTLNVTVEPHYLPVTMPVQITGPDIPTTDEPARS